jgi:hypothetical protein
VSEAGLGLTIFLLRHLNLYWRPVLIEGFVIFVQVPFRHSCAKESSMLFWALGWNIYVFIEFPNLCSSEGVLAKAKNGDEQF